MSLIAYVTQIQFGPGVLSTLREECARVGIRRPLIVTDRGAVSYTHLTLPTKRTV